MTTETMPTISLTAERICCTKHLEPFRDNWPHGFETFGEYLLDAYTHDKGVDRLSVLRDEDARAIEAELDRHPLCELVGPADLEAAYLFSGIGRQARCMSCGEDQWGTKLLTRGADGVITTHKHICFTCLISKFGWVN